MGNAVYQCANIKEFIVDDNNPEYKSIDGVIYSKDEKTLMFFPAGLTGDYVFSDKVTKLEKIAGIAFMSSKLTSIKLPETVKNIQ